MIRHCKCGGRLVRNDIIPQWDPRLKRVLFRDIDPEAANWECDRCGAEYSQKKRQHKSAPACVGGE